MHESSDLLQISCLSVLSPLSLNIQKLYLNKELQLPRFRAVTGLFKGTNKLEERPKNLKGKSVGSSSSFSWQNGHWHSHMTFPWYSGNIGISWKDMETSASRYSLWFRYNSRYFMIFWKLPPRLQLRAFTAWGRSLINGCWEFKQ